MGQVAKPEKSFSLFKQGCNPSITCNHSWRQKLHSQHYLPLRNYVSSCRVHVLHSQDSGKAKSTTNCQCNEPVSNIRLHLYPAAVIGISFCTSRCSAYICTLSFHLYVCRSIAGCILLTGGFNLCLQQLLPSPLSRSLARLLIFALLLLVTFFASLLRISRHSFLTRQQRASSARTNERVSECEWLYVRSMVSEVVRGCQLQVLLLLHLLLRFLLQYLRAKVSSSLLLMLSLSLSFTPSCSLIHLELAYQRLNWKETEKELFVQGGKYLDCSPKQLLSFFIAGLIKEYLVTILRTILQ